MVVLGDGFAAAAYVPVTIQGQRFMFRLDTGAGTTILTTGATRILSLLSTGPPYSISTLGCRTSVQPVRVTDWKLGDVALAPMTIGVSSIITGARSIGGLPVAGLLGANALLALHRVTLEFAAHRLILGGPTATSAGIPIRTVRDSRGEAGVLVPVTIHSVEQTLLLDTGSPVTALAESDARELHLPTVGRTLRIRGAAGCALRAVPVNLSDWKAGGTVLPMTLAVAVRGPSDSRVRRRGLVTGLLGADVVSRYRRATLDFDTERLVLFGPRF